MSDVKDVAGELKPDPESGTDKAFDTADKYTKGIPVANGAVGVGKGFNDLQNQFDEHKKGGAGSPDVTDLVTATGSFVADTASTAAGWAGDIAGIISDPVGALISAGLDWLLSVVQPLQDALNFVSGDSKSINDAADKFSKFGDAFDELSEDFAKVHGQRTAQWKGDAANAAAGEFGDFAGSISALSAKSTEVSRALSTSGMIMDMIAEVIKSIISSLIEWLVCTWLAALAASIITFGASDAAAATATPFEVGMAMEKAGSKTKEVETLLTKLAKLMEKAAEKGGKNVEKAAAKKATKLEKEASQLEKVGTKEADAAAKKAGDQAKNLRMQQGRGLQRRLNKADAAGAKARKSFRDAHANKDGSLSQENENLARKEGDKASQESMKSDLSKPSSLRDHVTEPMNKLRSKEGRQEMAKDWVDNKLESKTGLSRDVLTGKKPATAMDVASATKAGAGYVKSGFDTVDSAKNLASDTYTVATEGQSDAQTSSGFNVGDSGGYQSNKPVTDWEDEEEYPHHSVFDA